MRARLPIAILVALASSGGALAALTREVTLSPVNVRTALPVDLLEPDGKSRWHLESLSVGAAVPFRIVEGTERISAGPDTFAGPDRARWALPDRDPSQMRMGARLTLELSELRDGIEEPLEVEVSTVGIGWVHLPSGPREAVLQRALIRRFTRGVELVHRWVDPRAGVVAEISGPADAGGSERLEVRRASVVDEVRLGAADLKIYADEMERGPGVELKYGWDRGQGATIASLVPDPGIVNVCDLVNLDAWNFTGTTSGAEVAYYQTPVNAQETCNFARCGYTVPGGVLGREDRNITGTVRKDHQVTQRENRPTDVTIWLRGGTQAENVAGAFGTGESGFCFADSGTIDRKDVPLWRFSHNDAEGWYLQAGDAWESEPLDQPGVCQETFYTTRCGATQPFTPNPLYARACTSSGQTHLGKQSLQVVKGGVVSLPSGHTLNALVIRNMTDFCIYAGSSCGFVLDRVRTLVYYWQVPYLGSVALIRSPKTVNYTSAEMTAGATHPCTNFTTVDYTNIGFGLFPPVSMTAGTATDTTVELSWNPGSDTHRIGGYKVYWDTDSGAATPYAFNSTAHPGQVSFAGTSATISGLTPGTTYYFTVTSLSSYTDPASLVTTGYESIVYPTTVSGDPAFAYPVEVQKATTGGGCTPTQEVTGLTVDKAGPNLHVCWTATSDACALGYDVLGASSPSSAGGFTVVGQVGLTTCWDGNPSQGYVLVRSRGGTGNGPWGHFGQ